jgi:ribosome-binding protein aMBF1 (putative translation factor)
MSRSMKDFGQYIRQARENAGFSQLCLGVHLGQKNGQLVYAVEAGIKKLPAKHARKLAEVLSLDEKTLREKLVEIERLRIEEAADGNAG